MIVKVIFFFLVFIVFVSSFAQNSKGNTRILEIKSFDDSLFTFLIFDFEKKYSYYIDYYEPSVLQTEGGFDIATFDSTLLYSDTISLFHSPVDGVMWPVIHKFHAKKLGEWKYYYSNGRIHYSGSYTDNLKNGEWLYYSDSGELQIKRIFLNGRVISQNVLTKNSFVIPER